MLVSWKWLQEYVALDMEAAELEDRFSMTGLNHEGSKRVDGDLCIDLEVTSNRGDCLGHIGVAREVSVLYEKPLKVPAPQTPAAGPPVEDLVKVAINCPELCYRYTARVIRGVQIGPSPAWMVNRLKTIGINPVNSVVDITNYVMMECGQPLHAFDLALISGAKINIRQADAGEKFEAIDHRTYHLDPSMCVIADARRAVALGGVMGGADSEVSDGTTELLIEAAEFAPLAIRNTARKLRLHSPSSYRFERSVDPVAVNWASRRCCQLILELAGGELAEGVADVGREITARQPVVLRLDQIQRVLGIEIPTDDVRRILTALGNEEKKADAHSVEVIPPTWRRDLTREVDLLEEVARIHGYDQISEDVGVPMVPSHQHDWERVQDRVRQLLAGMGFDEAMTASVVPAEWQERFSPWTDHQGLTTEVPMLEGAHKLRSTLIPSILRSRKNNEVVANPVIELFEIARAYLPAGSEQPDEQTMLAITTGGTYHDLKGVLESMLRALNPQLELETRVNRQGLLRSGASAELYINDQLWGFLGTLTDAAGGQFELRSPTTVCEVKLGLLTELAELVPQHRILSLFPSMSRDLNIVLDETTSWAAVKKSVRASAGRLLEDVAFQEIYRDYDKDGDGKKRMLFTIYLNSHEETLSGEQADAVHAQVVEAIANEHGGRLLA